jgi:hypothetical protein
MDEAMAIATAVKEGASSPTTTGSACLIWYLTRYKRKTPTTHYDLEKTFSSSSTAVQSPSLYKPLSLNKTTSALNTNDSILGNKRAKKKEDTNEPLLSGILVMVVKPTNSILGRLFLLLVKDCLGEIKIRELGQIKFRVSHGNSSFHGIDRLSHRSEHRCRQVLTEVVASVRRKLGSVGVESIIMTVGACRTVEMPMVVIDGIRGLKRISVAERAHKDVSKLLAVIERKQVLSLINRS